MFNFKTLKTTLVGTLGVALAAFSASASTVPSFTPVSGTSFGHGEFNHAQIVASLYNGRFGQAGSSDTSAWNQVVEHGTIRQFRRGDLTITRVHDAGFGGALGTLASRTGRDDEVWRAEGLISARAVARFAGFDQTFGFTRGAAGGSTSDFSPLLTANGSGMLDRSQNRAVTFAGDNRPFRWVRTGAEGGFFTSNPADQCHTDMLVTYEVTGLGKKTWLLFWEDIGPGGSHGFSRSDRDFNDLVVELTVVPLPPAAWAGLTGLAMIAGFQHLRRRKHARD